MRVETGGALLLEEVKKSRTVRSKQAAVNFLFDQRTAHGDDGDHLHDLVVREDDQDGRERRAVLTRGGIQLISRGVGDEL